MDKNEIKLEKTAITFALESISCDLKELINSKISYNLKVINELKDIIKSIIETKNTKVMTSLLKENSTLINFLNTALEDYQSNIIIIDYFINSLDKSKLSHQQSDLCATEPDQCDTI